MTVGPTLVPCRRINGPVKGLAMRKISMEGMGMDVVDVGIRRCFFFLGGGWVGLGSTQILHIQ